MNVRNSMSLTGKHVLITGGTSGLGLSASRILVDKGARVWACGRTEESAKEARSVLPVSTYMPMRCDVLNQTSFCEIIEKIDHVDILINSAGLFIEGPLEENDPERIAQVIDVNLKGLILTTQAVLPGMKEQNSGIIVNVSSTAGLKPKLHQAVYAATKYGVRGFTESLKRELRGTNVDVLGFYPGKMNTPLMQKSGFRKDTSNWMNPDDVAEVLVYMLERPASLRMDKVVVKRRS